MAWTTVGDVTGAWIGPGVPDNSALIGAWIDKAERLLRSKVAGLADRVDADPVTEPDLLGNVIDVVVAMVQRVFRNPEGVRQRQEGTGPFTGSVTYGGDQPGALWVTDAELALISVTGSNRGAFTVDTIPVTSPYSPYYVPVDDGWV